MSLAGRRARALSRALLCAAALLLAGGTLAFFAGPAAAATGGWLCGTVRDAAGNPLEGIEIYGRLTSDAPGDLQSLAMTDTDGSWSTRRLPPGTYVLQFRDMFSRYGFQYYGGSSLAARATPVTVTDRVVLYDIDASMRAGSTIKGVVHDASGKPVKQASVDIFCPVGDGTWMEYQQTQSGTDGSYEFDGLAAGAYRLRFAGGKPRGGRVYYRGAATFARGREVWVAEGVTVRGVNDSLTRPGTITGRILSTAGRPLSGITVEVVEATAAGDQYFPGGWVRTTGSGQFRARGLGAGPFDLLAYDESGAYAPQLYRGRAVTDVKADSVDVSAGGTTRGVTFRLGRAGAVSGTVSGASGKPLRVYVSAYLYDSVDGWWSWPFSLAVTNSKGKYTLGGLPSGFCRIGFTTMGLTGYQTYFYNNVDQIDAGTNVYVVAGRKTAGIDQTITEGTSVGSSANPPAILAGSSPWRSLTLP